MIETHCELLLSCGSGVLLVDFQKGHLLLEEGIFLSKLDELLLKNLYYLVALRRIIWQSFASVLEHCPHIHLAIEIIRRSSSGHLLVILSSGRWVK